MSQTIKIMPMRFVESTAYFGIPTLLGLVGFYWLLPALEQIGLPLFWNYMISVVGIFPLLILFSLCMLRREQKDRSWNTLRERFRIRPIKGTDCVWTAVLLIVFIGGQLILMPTSAWLASRYPSLIPDVLPHAINPRIAKSTIPTEFLNIPLFGRWDVAVAYLIILILNITGEEFWWRGYILPREELQHGKYTWIIHGVLWTLFHIPFWWNLIALIPSTFSLSYVVSKLKNSTPGIIAHFALNGLGFVMILLGVIGIGG